MSIYPSWRYHKNLEPKLIQSKDEENSEWRDSPAAFSDCPVVEAPLVKPKAQKAGKQKQAEAQ